MTQNKFEKSDSKQVWKKNLHIIIFVLESKQSNKPSFSFFFLPAYGHIDHAILLSPLFQNKATNTPDVMTVLKKYWPSIWSCLVLELYLNAFCFLVTIHLLSIYDCRERRWWASTLHTTTMACFSCTHLNACEHFNEVTMCYEI